MLIRRSVVSMLSVGTVVLGAGMVSGQDYPNKPVRIITGGVGGGNDFGARLVAPGLASALGQQVIIDNRGGSVASGEAAAKAPPDGYSLLFVGPPLWTGPLLRKMPWDPIKDFSPITLATSLPNFLVVHPSLPVKSVKELIALAKAKPGELNYSFGTAGASGHIGAELFKSMAGVNIVGITFKSDSQEIGDLITGRVQLTFQSKSKVGSHIDLGKLRALAVGSLEPSTLAPGLPPIAASVPGFESVELQGGFAPAKTPEAIIKRLSQELVRVLNQADVKKKFFDTGVEAIGSSPEQFAAKIKSEMTRMAKVIKDAGIKTE